MADLLPLWPAPMLGHALLSLMQQLPLCLATQPAKPPDVRKLAACLASVPKVLPHDACASLLAAVTSHGAATFKQALARSDVTALLLGVLCAPGLVEAATAQLTLFYGALLPIGAAVETPWALLNAVLPATTKPHAMVLEAALGALDVDGMGKGCKAAAQAFGKRLATHVDSLGDAPVEAS